MIDRYPDLLARLRLGRAHADLRSEFEIANRELSSGEKEDVYKATAGDPGRLSALDRMIARVEARQPLLGLAEARASATGEALDLIRSTVDGLGVQTLDSIRAGGAAARAGVAAQLDSALATTLSALNTEVRGRPLFAGIETDGPPFAGGALASFKAAVEADVAAAAPADAASLAVAFDAAVAANWGTLYSGGGTAPGVELAEGERLDYLLTGDHPDLVAAVRDLALGAWAGDLAALSTPPTEPRALLEIAGGRLLSSPTALTELRAELGVAEERIETARTRHVAERTALDIRRNDLVGVDQFEAASRVLELESRIQALYEVTARAARLSFLDFMR